jgi:uncharacterized protein (TIGR00369 family)
MDTQIPVINPYTHRHPDDYHCFGCSPHNAIGLQMTFLINGDVLHARWRPQKQFEGYHNVVHGGIQATLLDELAAWFVNTVIGSAGLTKKMDVEYLFPVVANQGEIHLAALLHSQNDKEAVINAQLFNGEGKLCTQARVTYLVFPEEVAKRKFNYPGKAAFFANPPSQMA